MTDTRWVSAKISERAHEALKQEATDRGVHTSQLVTTLIEDGLSQVGKDERASLEVRLFYLSHQADKEQIIEQQLERIAWFATHRSDESMADELERLCELSGHAVEEIINRIKDWDSPPIVIGHDATGKDAAMRWLQDRFHERDTWLVKEIQDLAKRAGFSSTILNRAKRELGIISQKKSAHWSWIMNKKDYNEHEQQQHDL